MHRTFKQDRDAIVVMFDQALLAETRTEPPSQAERSDWLYGSAGFTEPDEHGWIALLPQADVWVPRALMFWRMAVLTGTTVSDEQMCDRCHSLARWPSIEAVIGHMLGAEGA